MSIPGLCKELAILWEAAVLGCRHPPHKQASPPLPAMIPTVRAGGLVGPTLGVFTFIYYLFTLGIFTLGVGAEGSSSDKKNESSPWI